MTVDEFAKEKGYGKPKYLGLWQDKKIYSLVHFEDGKTRYVGYPLVIIEDNGKFRISEPMESLDINEHFFGK